VLAEKIHSAADEVFSQAGYSIGRIDTALNESTAQDIGDVHVLGVRSRSEITPTILKTMSRLLAVGCFSVGTDAVAADAACSQGVPVFNAPHSSTRSVAELTLGNIIMLARRAGDRNNELHRGRWFKTASGSQEIRNKTLGIVGYGHIGQQVGLLAEAIGMHVIFFDTLKKLPLGRAVPVVNLEELLKQSDFVSLHVPATPETELLLNKKHLGLMRPEAYLLNLSRGSVVELDALLVALKDGKLAGAALDVYPEEPTSNEAEFAMKVEGIPNLLLTPHIGGSTEDAQENIGREVASSLIEFLDAGTTEGAVNFPQLKLPAFPERHRILHIHRNVPGVLSQVNKIIAELGINVDAQFLGTASDVGYLIMDVNRELSDEARNRIAELPESIRTRILYS